MRWILAKSNERSTCRLIESRLPFRASVRSIYLRESKVGDDELHRFQPLPALIGMELGYNKGITDRGVEALMRHPNLSYLHLWGTSITDASIDWLIEMPKLSLVSLIHTEVSVEACKRLATAKPDCLVNHSKTVAIFGEEKNLAPATEAWLNRDHPLNESVT